MANKDGEKPGGNGAADDVDDDDDKAGKGNANPSKDAGKSNDKSGGKGGDDKDDGGSGKKFSEDEVEAIVQRRLARAQKKAEDDAKLSKEQLLEKERDEANSKVRMSDARDAFITAATTKEHGLEYGQASKLFRYYRDEFEFDDKGKIENLKDVLKEAKSEWPELFKGQKGKPGAADLGGGGSGGDKSTGSGMNDLLRKAAGRGTKE